jgi:hypothetical protein
MLTSTYPFRYYAMFPESTLAIKIREESWFLETLINNIREAKKRIRSYIHGVKIDNMAELQASIVGLAREIKLGIRKLKFVYYYDSTLLYLYFRMLKHVQTHCKSEEKKLKKNSNNLPKELHDKSKKDLKKARKELAKHIRQNHHLVHGLDIGEKHLISTSTILVNKLRKLRWGSEKQVQGNFTISRLSLLGMGSLNRKIKVEAIKVKRDIMPREHALLSRLSREINPKDVVELASLVSKGIKRTARNAAYTSKLISKFKAELKPLEKTGKKIKGPVKELAKQNNINEESIRKIIDPLNDAIKYAKEQIHNDLMKIFRNMFVEYKYVGTRALKAA